MTTAALRPRTQSSLRKPENNPPMLRRSQQERNRDARERLLNATVDVLMQRGYNGLTIKEVAKTAGMSNGALMHHYATKEELVIAATTVIYDQCILHGQRIAKTAGAVKNPLAGFIEDSISVYFNWPYVAALEVIMVARTDQALMQRIIPVMQHYRETTNALWLDVFRQAGYSEATAQTILNLTLNIVRGMGINRTWKRDDTRYKTLLEEWKRLVEQQFGAPKALNTKPPKKKRA